MSTIPFAAGLILGIFLLVTFFISIFAVLQKNHVTIGLVILNWLLIADGIVVLVIGTIIWFYSLHQRQNYFDVFKAVSPQTRIDIQDKVRNNGSSVSMGSLRYSVRLHAHSVSSNLTLSNVTKHAMNTLTVLLLRILCLQRHNDGNLLRLLLRPDGRQPVQLLRARDVRMR